MIQNIIYKKKILAIIFNPDKFKKNGVNFISPNKLTLQVGVINYKKNHNIIPHTHLSHLRKIKNTAEVLYIKKGILRVDFYDNKKKYILSKLIKKGDIIILHEGSHGFKVIKDVSMVEIKQGPFVKKLDKIRFNKTEENKIKIK